MKFQIFALLMILSATACQRGEAVDIQLSATFNGAPVSCTKDLSDVQGNVIQLRDLRFYAHNLQLIDAQGKTWPLKLSPDAQWQNDEVVLIDHEDATGHCSNGTSGTNTHIRGLSEAKDPKFLTFTMGVPFDLNHQDPGPADSPLNLMSMHWGWRAGYKFLRMEIFRGDDIAEAHIGSTGCEGEIGAITHCTNENRGSFKVALSQMQGTMEFQDLLPISGKCMGEPGPNCTRSFAAMNLNKGGGSTQP